MGKTPNIGSELCCECAIIEKLMKLGKTGKKGEIMAILNLFYQNKCKRVKNTCPDHSYPKFSLKFKQGELREIMRIKGWKTYAEVAEIIGCSRQLVSMMANRKASVSIDTMLTIAYHLGNLQTNWWVHYDVVFSGVYNEKDPSWNYRKYKGNMPYTKHSISSKLRDKDFDDIEEFNT